MRKSSQRQSRHWDLTNELLSFCARIFITGSQKGLQGFPLCPFVPFVFESFLVPVCPGYVNGLSEEQDYAYADTQI